MKRILVVALLFVCLAGLPSISSSGDKKHQKEANLWMKSKTKLSQEVLVGLTDGDFEKVQLNARALNFGHYLEVLFHGANEEYRQQMSHFTSANKELIRQAEAKNIYGATLAYNQLTVSCVQCHIVVRKAAK